MKLQESLAALGFDVHELQGDQMVDRTSILDDLGASFEFDKYISPWGRNWAALHDCWGEVAVRLSSRTALLWHHADRTAAAALKPFVEAVAVLHEEALAMQGMEPPKQLEIVLLGSDAQFPDPQRPNPL
jgi:hypothetical protein